jgi:hypothetical protein
MPRCSLRVFKVCLRQIELVAALIFTFTDFTLAHSGRTDSSGGHFNRSTGEYHFHDGRNAGRRQSAALSKKDSSDSWMWVAGISAAALWLFLRNPNSKSGRVKSTALHQQEVSDYYYLSSAGTRHNRRCRYYRQGRPCRPTDGVSCRLCGG